MWEFNSVTNNESGNSLAHFLENNDCLVLYTPCNFVTRIDPSTRKCSTIDLSFSSRNLEMQIEVNVGPYWSSDH